MERWKTRHIIHTDQLHNGYELQYINGLSSCCVRWNSYSHSPAPPRARSGFNKLRITCTANPIEQDTRPVWIIFNFLILIFNAILCNLRIRIISRIMLRVNTISNFHILRRFFLVKITVWLWTVFSVKLQNKSEGFVSSMVILLSWNLTKDVPACSR